MESDRGETMPDLIQKIEEKSREFDFFQAVTLLEEYFQKKGTGTDPLKSGRIQFSSGIALV